MTDQFLILNPIIASEILGSLLFICVSYFSWLEWKRKTRWFLLRTIAICLIGLSLFGIFLRPSIKDKRTNNIILLSTRYNQKKVDSLKNQFKDSHIVSLEKENSKSLEQISEDITVVVGDGLNPAHLELLRESKFNYLPSNISEGIVRLNLPKEIFANQSSTLTGTINNLSGPVNIKLSSSQIIDDSIQINKTGIQPFRLTFTPKQAGQFLYRIEMGSTVDTIPVVVNEQQHFKILMLEKFPTFEFKFLKNFLSENHQVVTRYEVSKNKFRYEYANQQPEEIGKITLQRLSSFDLLITTPDLLSTLPTNEFNAITNSVKNGLGLIMLPTEPELMKRILKLTGIELSPFKRDTATFSVNQKTFTLPTPKAHLTGDVKVLLKNRNRNLSAVSSVGLGKVGFQLLQETYQLQLGGDSLAYSKLWTDILQESSRFKLKSSSITMKNDFPIYEDDPLEIEIINKEIPEATIDSVRLTLNEDVCIDDFYHVRSWASSPGWHQLQINGDSTQLYFFVSGSKSWNTLRNANNMMRTQMKSGQASDKSEARIFYNPVSPLIFFIMLIIAFSTVWLLPKL